MSITGLFMQVKPHSPDLVDVALKIFISNGPGHDKEVTLLFEVLNGEDVVASGNLRIRVPEEKMKTGFPHIATPTKDLKTDPMTKLRITVRTQNY